MKIKQVLAVILAMASVSCFAACGGGKGGDGGDDSDAVSVTFDAGAGAFRDGGKNVSVKAGSNGKVKLPSKAPVRDGYAFLGWFNGSAEFDPDTAHAQDTTYTATYVSGNAEGVYENLFDTAFVISVNIDMSDAEWKKLDADYDRFSHHKSPIYRLADSVTIAVEADGETYEYYYEEVGIRMKGNTSRRRFYGDDGFYANVHFKMSFTQTFDDEDEYEASERKVWSDKDARKARKNRTFAGLEKIDLKYNKNKDETYSKDVYAMKLFRDNGIIAPNATLCAVSARECDADYENLGVYMLYEAVDELFLARNLKGDDTGDLYKCSWGNSSSGADLTHSDGLVGVEDELNGEFYAYDKKTNKKKTNASGGRDFSSMINFIAAANAPHADYSDIIDTDYFARFEAVNYILGNPDCIRNQSNNYYIYFRPSDGKAIIIPYDYDRCFGITKDWAPNNACLELTPYDNRTSSGTQNNPLYLNLITSSATGGAGSVKEKYKEYLTELAGSNALKPETFNGFKNVYKAHYDKTAKSAIESNNTRFDADDTGNMSYEYYIAHKLDVLNENI